MLRHLLAFVILVYTAEIAVADSKPVVITDKAIVVRDQIYFETAKAVLEQESFAPLDALAVALDGDKHLALVEIQVHTDERGADKWNLELSQKRADAILDYLVHKGVASKRLRATGYGESRPLDKHHNEAAWAKNRRIEFAILQRES